MRFPCKFFCLIPAGFLIAALLVSCGYREACDNRAKLSRIRIGMTHAQVREIMGEPPDESFQRKNLLFYYTNPKWSDGAITRDECTPFVFDESEDRLLGFGFDYYRKNHTLSDWTLKSVDSPLKQY